MKKLISLVLIICALFALISCNSNSEWQKAEHTYSQLGFSVSYEHPRGSSAVSSDDDPIICIYKDGTDDKLDWSISMSVVNMNHLEFEDYKGNAAKTASDIKQKDDIWTFVYKEPQERTIMLKYFECGKLLIMQKANDFDYDNAFNVAKTFEINVWGEDIR